MALGAHLLRTIRRRGDNEFTRQWLANIAAKSPMPMEIEQVEASALSACDCGKDVFCPTVPLDPGMFR